MRLQDVEIQTENGLLLSGVGRPIGPISFRNVSITVPEPVTACSILERRYCVVSSRWRCWGIQLAGKAIKGLLRGV